MATRIKTPLELYRAHQDECPKCEIANRREELCSIGEALLKDGMARGVMYHCDIPIFPKAQPRNYNYC